jgi:hypothetical protein
VADYVVIRSAFIDTPEEARRYYQERIVGATAMRRILCHGREVVVYFDHAGTHAFTKGFTGPIPAGAVLVRRRIALDKYDDRAFDVDRARLMDYIIPAIQNFTFSIPGTSPEERENRLLHGPRLPDGRYLRVALSPGPRKAWYFKSAYPIEAVAWRKWRTAKTVKFPP